MLSVIGCSSLDEIFEFNYLRENGLDEQVRENIIVCPHPESADNCRSILEKLGLSKSFDVITISRFMADELASIGEEDKKKNKSSLQLDLAFIWKSYINNWDYQGFLDTFDLFTDLRSFNTDLENISEALNYFEEDQKKALTIFWHYLDQAGIYDEHLSYKALSDFYRASHDQDQKIISSKKLIFLDFYHLSATQTDLLKSLAIRNDVYLPIPDYVLENCLPTDWPVWLEVNDFKKTKSFLQEEELENIFPFSQGRISEVLASYLNGVGETPKEILVIDESDAESVFYSYPKANVFYKKKIDFFLPYIKQLDSWVDLLPSDKNVKNTVTEYILNKKEISDKDKNYHGIKFYGEFLKLMDEYSEISENNKEFFKFDLKILIYVVKLNLPRIFTIPVIAEESYLRVKTLSKSWAQKVEGAHIIAFSSTSLKTKLVDRYPRELASLLGTLGPIKNSRIDKLFQMSVLKNAINDSQNILFLDDSLIHSDPGWAKIVGENFKVNALAEYQNPKEKELDPLAKKNDELNKLTHLSYTKLQSYLDCPRKYYHSYIDKLAVRPSLTTIVDAALKGTMYHEFVEAYFNHHQDYEEKTHLTFAQVFYNSFLEKYNLSLIGTDREIVFHDLIVRTSKVCSYLAQFSKRADFKAWFFEKEVNHTKEEINFTGSIDLYIEFTNGIGIIDFKSSSSGIPSVNAIKDLKKIQTLFYSKRLREQGNKVLFQAYINFSSLKESMFLTDDTHWGDLLSSYEIKLTNMDIASSDQNYDIFEPELINKIKSDTSYVIAPVGNNTCTYCPASLLCPKGEVKKGLSI